MSALIFHFAVILPFIEADHVILATAQASAQSAQLISPCPASVAEACNAHRTSAESPHIPEIVATAERIRPRSALDMSHVPASVASPFFHHARFPLDILHVQEILKPAPSHHAFGASIHVYGGVYPCGTELLLLTHTTCPSQ